MAKLNETSISARKLEASPSLYHLLPPAPMKCSIRPTLSSAPQCVVRFHAGLWDPTLGGGFRYGGGLRKILWAVTVGGTLFSMFQGGLGKTSVSRDSGGHLFSMFHLTWPHRYVRPILPQIVQTFNRGGPLPFIANRFKADESPVRPLPDN